MLLTSATPVSRIARVGMIFSCCESRSSPVSYLVFRCVVQQLQKGVFSYCTEVQNGVLRPVSP